MQFDAKEFFDYYEAAHQNAKNRYVHHIAHVVAVIAVLIIFYKPLVSLVLIAVSFGLSWVGHYLFEKNTPAFFDTDKAKGKWDAVSHPIKVASGGVVWTLACFLRVLGLGPLNRKF